MSPHHHLTTLEEVASAIEDVVLTPRFDDFRIDPSALRPDKLRPDFRQRFKEPYFDPDAHKQNIPDFMVSAMVRMMFGVLDYALMIRRDSHVKVNSYWVLGQQREALRRYGYDVFVTEYDSQYFSQLLALRCKRGVFFAPLDLLNDPLVEERLQEEAQSV